MFWTRRRFDAPAAEAWALLTDLDRWPIWGPTVAGASLDEPEAFVAGATGRVRTSLGPTLPFTITAVTDDGTTRSWSWRVAGIPATGHEVVEVDPDRCEVGFGVPRLAAPYLVVCNLALDRIGRELAR